MRVRRVRPNDGDACSERGEAIPRYFSVRPGRTALLLVLILTGACIAPAGSVRGSSAPAHSRSHSQDLAAAPASPSPAILGPGGMTLDEEVGAVMMVGF